MNDALAPGVRPVADADRSSDVDATAWLVALLIGLSVLAVGPLVPWYRGLDPYQVIISVAHALTCAVGVAVAVHRSLRPCLLVASVFPYCWLVVPAVYQISHQAAAWGDPGVVTDYGATLRGQLVLWLGQAALLVGYAVSAALSSRATVGWKVPTSGRSRMLLFSAVLLAISILLVPLVVSSAGGVGALFQSREQFNQALTSNGLADSASKSALIKIVPSSLATGAAILALWLIRNALPGDPLLRRARVLAAVAVALLLIVANPFAFTRYVVLACFGSVAMAFFVPHRRPAALGWLGLSLFAFLFAYPAAETFRRGSPAGTSADPLLASKDFDGFQQAINTVTYVDAHGLSWGIHLLSGILFFVPRAIWSGKAVPSTLPIAEARGYQFQDLSMPLPAEAYLDLGWVGVVMLLGLIGIAWHRLDQGWIGGSRLSVVTAYVAVAQVGMWRGPFGSLAPIFGFTIGLLAVALAVSSASGGRRRQLTDQATSRVISPGSR